VVTDAPGRHRRPAPELQHAGAGMPISSAEFLQAPVDVAGSTDGNGTWGPGYGGMPALGRTDPGWPPDGKAPWPEWDAPPPVLHPDHPSAPVPRVRITDAPGGTGQSRGGNPSSRSSQPTSDGGSPRLPQRQPGRQPNPGARGRANAHPPGYDTGQYPAAQAGRPTRPGPRTNGRPQGFGPGPAGSPAQGYDTGQYPAPQTGRPTRPGPRTNGRPQGFGPGPAGRPAPGYDPGPDPAPPNGPGPANGRPQGFGPGPANAAAQGYALAQGYAPELDYAPDQPQPDRGNRRLYAVPDSTNPDGLADLRSHPGLMAPDAGPQAPGAVGFARPPVVDDGGQAAAAIRQAAINEAAAIRQAAEQDAASIRQQAAALREAAEKEAAHMRAVIASLSGQLSQMSAYVTENLASPGGAPAALATAATAALVAAPPVALPPGPATKPARPATRPAAPTTRPARPTTQPGKSTTGTKGRQAHAARKMVALLATLVTVGAVSGAAELVMHGGPFFIFRANGAGATETGPVENQGPGQPDAPAAHHVPASGKHAK
jgi:hypothetical protein